MSRSKQTSPIETKSGKLRQFHSTDLPAALIKSTSLGSIDYFCLFALTATAALLRTYKLTEPPKVVFDEVNFGYYLREYFEGRFFIDVHPPLGKLIYYYIAVWFGYDGNFDFAKIGEVYDKNTPYIAMRLFSALCGAFTVPSTYLALRASFCRPLVAGFGAILVILENSLATQSRFIMLDGPLIFFTSLTVCSFQYFQAAIPFTRQWLARLFLTGVFAGLAISTKLTGLFTLLWLGIWSTYHLWQYIGDLNVSLYAIIANATSRVICLLAIPITMYMYFFSIHFNLLPYNGQGSGSVSPAFKAGFIDSNELRDYAANVSYGSTITLRHHRHLKYLHSHDYKYKLGSNQQQVTMYGFAGDFNDEWIIETAGTNFEGKFDGKFRPISNGDTVKLFHKGTRKYLRANDVRPPNSEHDYSNEVSCDGDRTNTEHSDFEWTVLIVDAEPHSDPLAKRELMATQSIFKLMHRGTRCILMGQNVFLPEWAFNQNQVLCMNEPTDTNVMWYIEKNSHPVIDEDKENYPRVQLPHLLFLQKFKEYHLAMWRTNNGFVKKHSYDSLPHSWPIPIRGIAFFNNGHGEKNLTDEPGSHIYMLGNLAIYVAGIVVVFMFAFKFAFYLLKHLNPFDTVVEKTQVTVFYLKSLQYISGWFLQYYPFVYFERKLFAHHYLTSVYFLILATAQYAEYSSFRGQKSGFIMMTLVLAGAMYVFITLFPLINGSPWTVQLCQKAKLLPTWDFDCMAYSE